MDSMNQNPVSVKSRAEYIAMAEDLLDNSFGIDPETEGLRELMISRALVYATLALAAPETPSLPDPCADELAEHLARQVQQTASLLVEKSALLDLLERAYSSPFLDCDSALEDDISAALREAGRL